MAQGVTPFLTPKTSAKRAARLVEGADSQLAKLIEQNSLHSVAMVPRANLDLDLLRQSWTTTRTHSTVSTGSTTAWAKLVCLYDY